LDLFADKEKLPATTRDYLASFHSTETITVEETVKEKQLQKVMEKQTNDDGEEVEVEVEKEVMVPVKKEVQKTIDKNRLYEIAGIDPIEQADLDKMLAKKDSFCLILGEDLINHPRSANIAKLAGLMEKYSDFKVLIVPPKTNTLGVALICDLDEEAGSYTVGYNVEGDFTLTAMGANGENELDMPALNQQEGTFTNIDKRVVPLNAAIGYEGHTLNEIANALGLNTTYTVDYTCQLPTDKGFKAVAFDDLENHYTRAGEEVRGYTLETQDVATSDAVEEIAEIDAYNGTVVYRCNPVLQFNQFTAKSKLLKEASVLFGSQQFATAAKVSDSDTVEIDMGDGKSIKKVFKIDTSLKGTVALLDSFDESVSAKKVPYGYRFKRSKIVLVGSSQ
jgi:NADH-quinone oxidoreductase subunit G